MNKYLELGQIVNVKGLKGEVKVNSFTDDNTKFERIPKVFIKQKQNLTEYEIEEVGYSKNQVILKFKNIDTVEEAEKLRNSYIVVDREIFGELPEGVYYIADLIGLDVYTENNEYLGKNENYVKFYGKTKNGSKASTLVNEPKQDEEISDDMLPF